MLIPFGETRALLAKYKLPMVRTVCDESTRGLLQQASAMKPPFVLKATGPNIRHKTERGLVVVGIHTIHELEHSLAEMRRKLDGENASFLVQET
ncbi:MAG: acetate--CoA ligase family protein, partial [Candidatus Micrarchaeota archaeon]